MDGASKQSISFDEFELDTAHRVLLRQGKAVAIYAKAFDLLKFLTQNTGRILTKDEILESVWEGQFVEEANLSVQISALRKALGETTSKPRFLVTVPGKGYKFIADVNNGNSEIVIEKHKLSRIVIEEEFDDKSSIAEQRQNSALLKEINTSEEFDRGLLAIRSRKTQNFVLVSTLLVVILMSVGFGIYRFYEGNTKADENTSNSGQMTITRLTDGKNVAASSLSPDGKFVAYVENHEAGAGAVFIHQISTSTTLQLTKSDEITFGCTNFSPDGSVIYYVVFDQRDPYAALYSIPVTGGNPKRILSNLSSCFTVSPDNKSVAFYRGDPEKDQTNLIIAALDGSGERVVLSRDNKIWKFGMGLAWSPQNNFIAISAITERNKVESAWSLLAADIEDGSVKPLAEEKLRSVAKMVWTNDGKSLVFIGSQPNADNSVFLMDYPSGQIRRITNDLQSYGNYGLGVSADSKNLVAEFYQIKAEIWSVDASGEANSALRITQGTADGRYGITALPNKRIAYTFRTINGTEILTANEDGTDLRPLTNDSFFQSDLASSADGRYLVFVSNQSGRNKIYRMNADDGSELTQLTFGDGIDGRPDVSPDGKWVVFGSRKDSFGTIWKVPIEGGESIQLTDYQAGSPRFSPDGKTIACEIASGSRAVNGKIVIISADGGQPLKSFQTIPFGHNYNFIQWTPDGKGIIFLKAKDAVFNLWKQNLSGEPPQQITDFPLFAIWNFTYSHDGKRLLTSRGSNFVDNVLIKDFR